MSKILAQQTQIVFNVDENGRIDLTALSESGSDLKAWLGLETTVDFMANFVDRMLNDINLFQNTAFRTDLIASLESANTQPYVPTEELSIVLNGQRYPMSLAKQHIQKLVIVEGHNGHMMGHPKIAIKLAQSISPEVAYKVSEWVTEQLVNSVVRDTSQRLGTMRRELDILQSDKDRLAAANQGLMEQVATMTRELDAVKHQLAVLQSENGQLVGFRDKYRQSSELIVLMEREQSELMVDRDEALAKLEAALRNAPPAVVDNLRQHVFLMRDVKNKNYRLCHSQTMNFKESRYPEHQRVITFWNVPCGTKIINIAREVLNGPRSEMKNSQIVIYQKTQGKEGDKDYHETPMIDEAELTAIIQRIVDKHLATQH